MTSNKIIDLTLDIHPGMAGVELEPFRTLEEDGWNALMLHLYSHCGTHIDAPCHFGVNQTTIDQLPLDRMVGPAWIADIPVVEDHYLITPEDLGSISEQFQPGHNLLLRTDWSRFANTQPDRYRQGLPRVSEDLAHWCVERQVNLLGVEPPSVADVNNMEEVTRIHRILLGAGIIIVEGLCNLHLLTQSPVQIIALPLKVRSGDGAPARVIAVHCESWNT